MLVRDFVPFAAGMLKAGLPFMVVGAPGIAKTALMKEAAELAGMDILITHPVVRSPIDYGGIPAKVKDGNGKKGAEWDFVPIGHLRQLVNATKPLACFFDDAGQASQSVQAALMQVIHERQIGDNHISNHVRFCAASNRLEDKSAVSPMIEAFKSRWTTIVELEVEVDRWIEWASDCDDIGLFDSKEPMPPVLVAFIAWKRSLLHDPKPQPGFVQYPSPRTVHHVGQMLAAGVLSLLHGVVTIHFQADQVVSGLSLTFLGTGLALVLGEGLTGQNPPLVPSFDIPGLALIPVIGPIFFEDHSLLVYVGYIFAPLCWYYIYKTRPGMHLRAVGEKPAAADTMGISVYGVRYFYVLVGGCLAGLAGATISLSVSPGWYSAQTTSGQGWIAIALVIFAQWDPLRAALGAARPKARTRR